MKQEITLRPFAEADMERLVAIVNAQSYEPTTLEAAWRTERNRRPEEPLSRLIAADAEGRVVGFGTAGSGLGMQPGTFSIKVRVDEPFREQGTGQALHAALEDWARSQGAAALQSGVREVDREALAWTERRGYVVIHHIYKSRLWLTDWDPSPWQDAVARIRSQGVAFTDLGAEMARLGPEEALRRFYDFIGPIVSDMPGAAGRQRAPYERWRSNIDRDPNWDPAATILAVDGDRWAAFASVNRLPGGGLFHGFTGVDREYRSRGLTLPVKVVALTFAQGLGVPYITTSNHSTNPRMLAVNQRLGYEPSPGSFTLQKALG